MLRKNRDGTRDLVASGRVRKPKADESRRPSVRNVKPKKAKRRKGLFKKFVEEAFDVIEDIFG
jgi:hypothetical protein